MDFIKELANDLTNTEIAILSIIPSTSISLFALLISIWNGFNARTTGRNSASPVLAIFFRAKIDDTNKCTLTFHNKGFGPAIIEDFRIGASKKAEKKFTSNKIKEYINKAFEDDIIDIKKTQGYEKGFAIGANESLTMAEFQISDRLREEDMARIVSRLDNLIITIDYKDIYGRLFTFKALKNSSETKRKRKLLTLQKNVKNND